MDWQAIATPKGAAVLGRLQQLEQSQWLGADQLRELQQRQLQALVRHARAQVPYYRERLGGAEELPLLSRRQLMDHFDALKSERLPRGHGAVAELRTSGSTGAPVRVLKTQRAQLMWNAITLRDHRWHRRDLSAKLAVIRLSVPGGETRSWGIATDGVVATGPAVSLGAGTDAEQQLDWLLAQRPQYLLTYPSNVAELARLSLARGAALPELREVRTFGEMLAPETRRLCRAAWGVPTVDVYSANEVGYIALQCPAGETYHVQSEAVLVEILDDAGQPCATGETGRVVVTDLENFATPLLRYDIGDYAEVAPACACGRGLPVLSRIAGRVRNMLVTADGKRFWPRLNASKLREIAPVVQHQAVQKELGQLELRLVVARPLDAGEEERLRTLALSLMPPGMRLAFRYCDALGRGPGGKFEDFICEVR